MKPTIEAYLADPNNKAGEVLYEMLNGQSWNAYVDRYPDLVAAGIQNGLQHYLYHGYREGRLNVKTSLPPKPGPPDPPQPEPQPPSPGGWTPPTTPGMHEICSRPGGFGMSIARDKDGLLIGTYRKDGQAKLLYFDGTLHELLSLEVESVYMIHPTPDGQPVFTTEVPAQVFKRQPDGSFQIKRLRAESDSCAFEILPLGNGLVIQAVDRAWGSNTQLFKGDQNGNNFQKWKTIQGRLLNFGTDGSQVKLCGSTGDTADSLPMICNENGEDKHVREQNFHDQQYSYIIGGNGIWNMGAQSITESRGHRNAYIDLFDGTNLLSVQDLTRPWTMDMQIAPNGDRYVVASVWKETDHATAELWRSTDNGWNWQPVCEIPMPAALAMHFADGGVYLVGGTYDKEMKVCFLKF